MPRRMVKLAAAVALAMVATVTRGEDAPGESPRLTVLTRVIDTLHDHYAEPARIEPRTMLLGALLRVSELVDELVVEGDEAGDKLTLRMNGDSQEVDLSPVTGLEALRRALIRSLGFVSPRTTIDARSLEYEAIDGVLSTLDPQTVLLRPLVAHDLKAQFRTDTAGVGVVIGTRGGKLVVLKVLPGAPGERIGLARGDVITEIDGHSTANRELLQLVDWLRGPAGSQASIVRSRNGGPAQRLIVTREYVRVQNVTAQVLLPDRVGYVRIHQFGGNTASDLRRALRSLQGDDPTPLRGVILDLRENAGGLLKDAVQVADLFLTEGPILDFVPSSTGPSQRASLAPDDVTAPVVVLVNGGSAGSSEIVAAALRDAGRALLVGERSVGLGHFQAVVDVEEGTKGAALKITVGRYRPPGGLSFAGVGLAPDVVARPGRVGGDRIDFFKPVGGGRAPVPEGEPLGTFRYIVDDAVAQPAELDADDPEEQDPSRSAAVFLAARILARATTPDRDGLLAAAADVVPQQRVAEEDRLASRLRAMGVDWTRTSSASAPEVKVTFAPTPRVVTSGVPIPWTITVENVGPGALSRLRAWTLAPTAPSLDGLELAIGSLPPGTRRSATVQIPSEDLVAGVEQVTLHFEDENGRAPADVATRFETGSVARPSLSARFNVTCATKRCGPLGSGVEVRVEATVRNSGAGPTGPKAALTLRSADGRVYATQPSARLGSVMPGAERKAALGFRLIAGDGEDAVPVTVDIEQGIADRIPCDLGLKRGDRLPLVRECHPVRLRLSPDPDSGLVRSAADHLAVSGTASIAGGDRVRRVIVRVNDRKVAAKLAEPSATMVDFAADVPLRPGINVVTVTAETRGGKTATRTFRLRRPEGQPTPEER